MARQFREQLEEEVQVEQARRAQAQAQRAPPPDGTHAAAAPPAEPMTPMPDTFSHAHPTDATGANPMAATAGAVTASADERGT